MSNSSDSEYVEEEYEEDDDEEVDKVIPGWMQPFLEASYFTCCEEHNDLEKNGLNKFCVTCVAPLCKHCIQTKVHKRHELLTIYHHSHKDVVPLKQIKKHIRCSQIQKYVQLACTGLAQSSGKGSIWEKNMWDQYTNATDNGFCVAFSCMCRICATSVHGFSSVVWYTNAIDNGLWHFIYPRAMKLKDQDHNITRVKSVENEREEAEIEAPPPVVVRHRRKGIPHRSPQ
ncbi:uncharacterized protein LOC116010752 [Ipomoea triloba]|uniref:uncharacterized protein LOC116010752 n=1 Tax=Ipomoea triloba TaxID=35885 RepID=UPI00125D6919|nr:uncharacterized protein LOC116010752 [Ipomoea triloba]